MIHGIKKIHHYFTKGQNEHSKKHHNHLSKPKTKTILADTIIVADGPTQKCYLQMIHEIK